MNSPSIGAKVQLKEVQLPSVGFDQKLEINLILL